MSVSPRVEISQSDTDEELFSLLIIGKIVVHITIFQLFLSFFYNYN